MIPDRAFPAAQDLHAQCNQAMEFAQEEGKASDLVGDDQMFVRGHEHHGMNGDAVARGENCEAVDVELIESGVGPQEFRPP